MKNIIYLILVILVSLPIGCDDPNEGNNYAVRDGDPVGTWLEKNENFSDWVSLLRRTNMFSILNVKSTYTCFVPTNEAIQEYLSQKGYQSINEITDKEALYLVQYHILAGSEFQTKVMTNGRLTDTTVSGDYLVTKFVGGDIFVNNYAQIVNRDIKVLNGYIHVLNKMLNPEQRSVWELLAANNRYLIFTQAVEKAGLQPTLNEISRMHTGGKAFVTAMVVPNEVFEKAGMSTLQDVIDEYSPSRSDYTDPSNPFHKYVAYHILSGMQSYNDLVDFDKGKDSKNVETMANNEMIMVEDVNNEVVINRDSILQQFVHIVDSVYNKQAINGIYHEIDHLMPVFVPKLSTVKIEFSDKNYFPEYAAIPFYRSGGGTYNLDTVNFPYVRWYTIPEGVGTVQYHRRTGWGIKLDYTDVVQANLGSIGWVEFDLPTIVKGKYRVSLNYHYAKDRGSYQFSFDPKNGDSGKNIGAPVDFKSTGYSGKLSALGIINFTETSGHTLRATVVRSGLMELDYILFEPVN